jgi:HAMP domain-containing protein
MFGAATVVLEAVLAGALWLILWSTVLRPLRKLEEYAASVAEVPGDAPAAAGFDEIGNVEASVRTMVGQLERRTANWSRPRRASTSPWRRKKSCSGNSTTG